MYSNYMYSNAPVSSRRGGGSWVYVNGELYHYGRPGMKWYQTIFGGYDNPKSMTYIQGYGKQKARNAYEQKMATRDSSGRNPSLGAKIYNTGRRITGEARAVGSGLRAVGRSARDYASYVKGNINKYYLNEAKTNVRNKINSERQKYIRGEQSNYASNAAYSEGFGNRKLTHIEEALQKQVRDGKSFAESITGGILNPQMSLSNYLNLVNQNMQANVLRLADRFVKKLGISDDVDRILTRFFGKTESAKRIEENQNRVSNNKTNSGYNRAESSQMGSGNLSTKHQSNNRGYNRAEAASPTYTSQRKSTANKPNLDYSWVADDIKRRRNK